MKKPGESKIEIDLSRRRLIASGPVFLLSAVAALQGCVAGSHRKNWQSPSATTATRLQFDFADGFNKLNAIRRRNSLPEFQNDPRLQKAAQDYANLMGSRGLYGHEIGPGTDFKSRILAVGYNNSSAENIGVGYSSVDKALKGWIKSPSHRKNMMKPDFTLAGLAYGFNTSGKNPRHTHFWVLIMGKADRRYS